jgi:deazaflavin-dependent oxidoreductase (nitroreductase family)
MSHANTWAYRATGGRLGGRFLRGAPVMLLSTVGRKTGQHHTTPLLYLRDGDRVVTVASKGGMDHHPLWYHNLVANPDVEVQIGTAVAPMRASTAGDGEKATLKLWQEAGVRTLPGGYLGRINERGINPSSQYIRVALVHDDATIADGLERMVRVLG